MLALPPLKDLLFGFELEGIASWPKPINGIWKAREYFARRFARRTGLKVHYSNCSASWHEHCWTLSHDKTISRNHPHEIDVEIKSPVFNGEDILTLPATLQRVSTSSIRCNESCGMHLHIGRKGQLEQPERCRKFLWKPQEIDTFMRSFQENADLVSTLVDPARLTGRYSRMNPKPPSWLQQALHDQEAFPRLVNAYHNHTREHDERNFAVNLLSLFDKGTIEIKLRQADDYVNATPFVAVLLHMAQAAIEGRPFSWNDYAAAIADDPILALPMGTKPSQPRRPLQCLPAAVVRQG